MPIRYLQDAHLCVKSDGTESARAALPLSGHVTYDDIAAALKAARVARGWSQEVLAARLSLSRVALTRYENSVRRPDDETLRRWAAALDRELVMTLGDEASPLVPTDAERRLLVLLRNLPDESVELVRRLALALPGHDLLRRGVAAHIELLEQSGPSAEVAGRVAQEA